MGKLPRPGGKDMLRFLEGQGFTVIRVRGSHHFLKRNTQHTCVPVHSNQPLKTGTLRSILRDIQLSPSEFERLWHV